MVRNALRKELTELLTGAAESRKPAVRRSRKAEWLYATDLPSLYAGIIPDTLKAALTGAGWVYAQEGDWLELRKTADEPPEDWYGGPFGPEAACCRSLLERQGSSCIGPSDAVQRMLIKAGEEGSSAYEDTCAILHREWAERLRKREALPNISRRYFGP